MGAKKYIDKIGETETHRLADGRTITLRLKGFNTFEKIWHTNIVNALSHCPDKRSVFDLLNEVIMTDEQKEHWQRHGITLDDVEAGLMFANEQSGILTPTMVKWINMWFAEQREPQPLPSSGKTDDFSHMERIKPITQFDMLALYSFLLDEGIITPECESFFADCIEYGDVSRLWNITPSKNRFKLAIHTLKDYYRTSIQKKRNTNPDWFFVVCNNLDKSTQEMSATSGITTDHKKEFAKKMKKFIIK